MLVEDGKRKQERERRRGRSIDRGEGEWGWKEKEPMEESLQLFLKRHNKNGYDNCILLSWLQALLVVKVVYVYSFLYFKCMPHLFCDGRQGIPHTQPTYDFQEIYTVAVVNDPCLYKI